jgi:riboflavin kinase/FMN adenylyltransferase
MSRTVLWTAETPSLGPAVVALGVFDGVHIGHQALLRDTVRIATAEGVTSVVLTFDRDPEQIVRPTSAAPELLDLDDRLALLSEQGADIILVVPFDNALAVMPPLVFLDEVLLGACAPVATVVGYDFRFGHRAEGEVDTLVRYGREHGFTVVAHDLVCSLGEPVTSTRIRGLVAEGDVAAASALLGRPHRVKGEVIRGRAGGVALGAPTANLRVGPYTALPSAGVYAGRARVGEHRYAAGISVGPPPTFPEATGPIEAHLLAFDGDLYGQTLTIEFIDRLRDQIRFEDPADLAEQITHDLEQVGRIVAGAATEPSGS